MQFQPKSSLRCSFAKVLRMLDGQQNTRQIFLKFLYNLFSNELVFGYGETHIFSHLNLTIVLYLHTELFIKEINIV